MNCDISVMSFVVLSAEPVVRHSSKQFLEIHTQILSSMLLLSMKPVRHLITQL